MNVTEMICSAMPLAASSAVPIQPIMTVGPTKSPLSARSVSPMGQPRRKTSKNTGQSDRQNRSNSAYCEAPRPGREEGEDQQDQDMRPDRGDRRPRDAQLRRAQIAEDQHPVEPALSAAPPSQAQSTTRGRSSAERCERRTSASTAGTMPNPAMRR
jgi:hypothetical protein